MPTVPLTNRFHTTTAQVATDNLGSALANSDRATYSMQDIVDTVTLTGGVDGSGTAGTIPKWEDSNTISNSIMGEAGGIISVSGDLGVDDRMTSSSILTENMAVSSLNDAPSSATDTGALGEIRWTDGYVYLCTATDTWLRAALTTW